MEKNTVYANLVEHFGKGLAARIYACAMIMQENTEKLADEEMETVVRFTIGALKRRRIQGGRKVLTWLEAVEKLELEQDEGRHYSMSAYADRDIKRIEAINRDGYEDAQGNHIAGGREAQKDNEARAVAMLAHALQEQHNRYNADMADQLTVKVWVGQYMANITKTKLAFIRRVLADVQAGKGISRNDAQNIRLRYVPKGVQADDFIELISRYAV